MNNIEILHKIRDEIEEISFGCNFDFHAPTEEEINKMFKDNIINHCNKVLNTDITLHIDIDCTHKNDGMMNIKFIPLDKEGEKLILKLSEIGRNENPISMNFII